MRSLTRREAFAVGIGLAATGLLAGCTPSGARSVNTAPTLPPAGPGERVTLTYWTWLKDMQKVADIWNAANPHIQVETVWIPGGNRGGYAKMHSALAAGGGPDLAQIEMRTLPEFLLDDGLVDLTRYGAADYARRFDPTLWNQVSFSGGVYGIPQDSGPMGTFYQPEVFERVGVQPAPTWPEWAENARRMRAEDVYLDCFPISDPSLFCSYSIQAGAHWFRADEDGWVIDLTDEGTLRVAAFFDTAIEEDLVQTGFNNFTPAWYAAAANGGIASVTTASWGDALVRSVSGGSGKWKAAPMPVWEGAGYGSSHQGGSTAAVLSTSRHPREALEFAVWLCSAPEGVDALIDNSGIGWSAAADYIGASRQQPSEFFSGQDYNQEVFAPASHQQNPDWSWWPITQQSFNILADGFRKKAQGLSLVDAVAQAEQQILTAFGNKGLRIRKAAS